MDEFLGEALESLLTPGNASELLREGFVGYLLDMYGGYIKTALWIAVVFMIPAVIVGVIYCFFGLRFIKVLVALDSALCGGTVFAVLSLIPLIGAQLSPGIIVFGVSICFVIGAALFGVLSWYLFNVFLLIHILGFGFFTVSQSLMTIGIPVVLAVFLGIIIGISLCILAFVLGVSKIVIGLTSVKGAVTLASFFQILSLAIFLKMELAMAVYFLVFIGFSIGGFLFQFNKVLPETDLTRIEVVGSGQKKTVSESLNQPKKTYNYVQATNSTERIHVSEETVHTEELQPVQVKWKLVGMTGVYQGAVFEIENSITIGRDASRCNLIYQNGIPGISRVQCQLYIRNGDLYISDNSSSYGTFVNGSRIGQNMDIPLKAKDIIRFGENNEFKIQT